jgi:hypothetical protein
VARSDWRGEVPRISIEGGCYDVKRRSAGQLHALFRLVDPMRIENRKSGEVLLLPEGMLSDGSSVPGPLWGVLEAEPSDLLLPGFAHDHAYRRGAKWEKPGGGTRLIRRYEADLLHIAVCRLLRVWKSDQEKIFYALRVAGGFAFRKRAVDWDGQG